MNDDSFRRQCDQRIASLQHPLFRELATASKETLLAMPRKHRSGTIKASTVYNRVRNIVKFLRKAEMRGITTKEGLDDDLFEAFVDGAHMADQALYQAQRDIRWFLVQVFGDDEGRRRAPANKPTKSWHPTLMQYYDWADLRPVWTLLDLSERVQFSLLCTGAPMKAVMPLTAADVNFQDDGLTLIRVNYGPHRECWIPVLFGEASIAAYIRLWRSRGVPPEKIALFPGPWDPMTPVYKATLVMRVASWGARANMRLRLAPRKLQGTVIAYYLAERFSPQFVAHIMGVRNTFRIDRFRSQVMAALEAGHKAGRPYLSNQSPAPGLVVCETCGQLDVPAEAHYCPKCGDEIADDATSERALLAAEMHDRLRRLLDLTGRTPEDVAAEAAAAITDADKHQEENDA